MTTTKILLCSMSLAALCAGCETHDNDFADCTVVVQPGADPTSTHDAAQTALSNAQPGNVICFAAGTYALQDQLVLTTPNVEIRGAGEDTTVLDFANQLRGPNGVWVIADGFTMDQITVKNSAAAAIRIQQSKGIELHDVTVTWDDGSSTQNGGYGFYPTECANVIMEHNKVSYAEDAGFYIGQSQNVIIRNNEAFGNTIGIEFENTTDSEAYGNDSHDNVGGMLLSNLPNLPHHGTSTIRVYDNRLENNNTKSFAAPGSAASVVPTGSGLVVLAATDSDIHDNTISGNESIGAGVFSYAITMRTDNLSDATYEQYPSNIYIHDNHFKNNGYAPQDSVAVIADVAGVDKVEDIVWDGELAPGTGASLCLSGNGSASYRNVDYADQFAHTNTDITPVTCTGTSLMPLGAMPPAALEAAIPTQPHDKLSEYGFFTGDLKTQTPAAGVTPYEVAVSLYADGADKLRFIVLPAGGKISFDPTGQWQFPEGTTLIKTFFYDANPLDPSAGRTLVETRLEMLLSGIWVLQTYLWNDAQTEATRFVAGKTVQLPNVGHEIRVPSSAECHICHLSNNVTVPLGPRTWQLNVPSPASAVNQIDDWAARGYFAGSVPSGSTLQHLSDPFGSDTLDTLDTRARSYLEANCAHCHSEGGTADATGLRLTFDTTDLISLGYCRSPVSAGPGSGDLLYDIVPGEPKQSIIWFRMQSPDPNAKMPQLPTTTNDPEGVGLIQTWITSLTGSACPAQ